MKTITLMFAAAALTFAQAPAATPSAPAPAKDAATTSTPVNKAGKKHVKKAPAAAVKPAAAAPVSK